MAFLYPYHFSSITPDANLDVTFMYLYWSPLTEYPKESLDEPGLPHHAILTTGIKYFEQNYLSDVVLYAGKYREIIRPAVQGALCRFVGGIPELDPRYCSNGKPDIPTVVITHSLGGYMFMDALNDIYNPRQKAGVPAPEHNAAFQVGSYLNQIFMLANQLKILDLTTRTSELQSSHVMDTFRANLEHIDNQPKRRNYGPRQFVAISDPNDVLSWQITDSEIEKPKATVANVYLGTTGEIFGLYHTPILEVAARPDLAHVNYLVDDDVIDIIVCGMTGSTINRCAR